MEVSCDSEQNKEKQRSHIFKDGDYLCLSCPSEPFAVQGGGFEPRFWTSFKRPMKGEPDMGHK